MTNSSEKPFVLSNEEIMGLLPHRYPFALVDRVVAYEAGKSATAIKNVTINEPHFQGHFPERPLMPGVLIVEAMAQVGGLIVTQMPDLPQGLFVFLLPLRCLHPTTSLRGQEFRSVRIFPVR